MNRRSFLSLFAATFAPTSRPRFLLAPEADGCRPPRAPVTIRRPLRIEQLGRIRVDDYAWLKDPNWKEVWKSPATLRPEIAQHLRQENAYATAVLQPTEHLQNELFREMSAFPSQDALPPEQADGAWTYVSRLRPGAQHLSYFRRARDGAGQEQMLLDVEKRAAGRPFLHVAEVIHSPDGKFLAWSEDEHGSERFRIFLKDLETGEALPGEIQNAFGSFVFSPDSRWLFWVLRDGDSRPSKVYRRPVRGQIDTLVYEEHDPGLLMSLNLTAANSYVMIRCWNAETSEVRLIPASSPTGIPAVVEPRTPGLVYSVEDWMGKFVILTNADEAVDFKLMWASHHDASRRSWRDWIPYRPGHYIIEMLPFQDYFVRTERVDGNARIRLTRGSDMTEHGIQFAEAAYSASVLPGNEYSATELKYVYQSPREPKRWVAYDMAQRTSEVLKQEHGAEHFHSDDYVVERQYAAADDGAQVPITILRRRSTPLNGRAPLLLYGYGSYGAFVEPEFSGPLIPLIDRGWVYAIAHVRGGSAKGWGWFLQARRLHKKRTFEDFVACARQLIAAKYTSGGKIVIHGFSAGGLLVAAANNMRPDLWAGVIGQAPFVDMLNTMSDATHPLVPLTRPDWGDPLADSAAYDYIASYSPYENVHPQTYPPALATTNVADDRVGYWEPAKWIAKLRQMETSANPMLLRVQFEGGHGGNTDRDAELRQTALFFAFAIWAAERRCRPGALADLA